MKFVKKPILKKENNQYPSLKAAKLDRRKFLALLGGGVASSALLTACFSSIAGLVADRF